MTESAAPGTLFAPSIEQQAVRDRGHASNVLVAAAGSGKTRVLTWLYCDAHVEANIPLSALLAITFTDKAAGELRRRIATELEGHTLGREPDLSEAWIGTFHGVCARILREFAHRRGLDPAFGVIEELQALELQAQAWDDAVEHLLDDFGADAASLVSQVGDAALRGAIIQWWKARRSAGEVHPEMPTPRTTGADVVWAATQLMRACERFASVVEDEQSARVSALPSLAKYLVTTEGIAAQAQRARELAGAGAVTAEVSLDLTALLDAHTPRRGNPLPSPCEELEAMIEARAGLQRKLAELIAAPRVALLASLVSTFSRSYEACKRRNELLDFDDLELEALQLLREDDDVRLRLVDRFERVLVDEFQDTNPRQAELVDLLAGGPMWIPVGGDGRPAVTVVGDPRQAIYGFRYADVALIGGATERLAENENVEGDLRLSTNYRSDAEVLAAIDDAFAALDDAHEPVRAFRGPDQLPGGAARVELLITREDRDESWREIGLGARPGEGGGPALAEARLIAARIAELRAAEPERSIVVLARARATLGPVAEALTDLAIPALIDGADGFWERLEVADLLSWLRLVRNPADDAALVAVCASPLVGLSIDGLAAVGLLTGDRSDGGRACALRAAATAGDSLDTDDRGRAKGLFALLDRQREPGRSSDPAALLDEVVAATAYDEHVLRLVGGDRRAANIVRLRRIAAEVAANGGGLTDVVERAEKEQGHELRAPEASVAGSDAVTLMTVHQAKGLEFDTVVVAGLGSQQVISSPALLGGVKKDDRRLGLRLRPSPGAPSRALFDHEALVEERQAREGDELRRVLYVALTRARERLIVSGVARWTKEGSPFARKPSKSAPVLSWLAPALVPEIDALIEPATLRPQRTARGIQLRVSTPDGETLGVTSRAPEVPLMPVHVGAGPRLHELELAGPPALGAPRVLSYSALAAHAKCGLRFHAEQVLGLDALLPPETAGSAPSVDRLSYASARAPADQPDLFSTLDKPALPAGLASAPLPRHIPAPAAQGDLFATSARGPQVVAPPAPELEAGFTPHLTPADVGNAVHALLERLAPISTATEIAVGMASVMVGSAWASATVLRDEVRTLTEAALNSAIVADLWAQGPPQRELPFTIPVGHGEHLVSGVLDAWSLAPDGTALVVDYKTDRVTADDLERKVATQYTLQRDAYALAALGAGAKLVRVVHLFLRDPSRPVQATFAVRDIPAIQARLQSAIARVAVEPATATVAPHAWLCEGCPARGTLCGWSGVATARAAGSGAADAADWQGNPGEAPVTSS